MIKNESSIDRMVRAVLGVALALLALFVFAGIIQIVFYVLAAVMIFTAVTGFCALYKLFGINTNKNSEKGS